MTDSIADLLVRIKNALRSYSETLDVPYSTLKEKIVKILVEEGYLQKFEIRSLMHKKFLRITLKYSQTKKPAIVNLKRVSTPGRRIYVDLAHVPLVESGFGTAIISTSKGVLTDEHARQMKVGGEVLCYVW